MSKILASSGTPPPPPSILPFSGGGSDAMIPTATSWLFIAINGTELLDWAAHLLTQIQALPLSLLLLYALVFFIYLMHARRYLRKRRVRQLRRQLEERRKKPL